MDGVLAEYNFDLPSFDMLYEEFYFLSRPPQQNIVEAVKQLINQGEEVFVLSAVLKDSQFALFEKHDWLDRYLPEVNCKHRIFTICGEDKLSYVPHFDPEVDVLVDDYSENCMVWAKAKGTYVKVSRNEDDASYEAHKHAVVIHPDMTPENIIATLTK